jgi:hypothetical protein
MPTSMLRKKYGDTPRMSASPRRSPRPGCCGIASSHPRAGFASFGKPAESRFRDAQVRSPAPADAV